MSKNFTSDELINMSINMFRLQLGERLYKDYIQYLIKKYKKHQIGELSLYFLDKFSEDHELCRQSIGQEIDSFGNNFWSQSATDVFDFIHNRFISWDEDCTESQIIDMFQNVSFLYAANCHIDKGFRKAIGVKVGFFS